jgi:glutaredoxin 3
MKAIGEVEVFSAGCPCCGEVVQPVRSIMGPAGEVEVRDMHAPDVAARAKELGIERVPAVVVDGELAECCAVSGVDKQTLRTVGIGSPQ